MTTSYTENMKNLRKLKNGGKLLQFLICKLLASKKLFRYGICTIKITLYNSITLINSNIMYFVNFILFWKIMWHWKNEQKFEQNIYEKWQNTKNLKYQIIDNLGYYWAALSGSSLLWPTRASPWSTISILKPFRAISWWIIKQVVTQCVVSLKTWVWTHFDMTYSTLIASANTLNVHFAISASFSFHRVVKLCATEASVL